MATSKKKKPAGRLGKGLSSLMAAPVQVAPPPPGPASGSVASPAPSRERAAAGRRADEDPRGTPDSEVRSIPQGDLHPNPLQPRRTFDVAALNGLAESLRAEGMIQPITAREMEEGGFEIVAGERRWRAAAIAGLERVPVIVRSLDDDATARWALIENVQREDLNPMDRAAALSRLCETQGLTHNAAADAVGLSRSSVSNLIRLLQLGGPVRRLVADGLLQMGHARALAGVADASTQERLATTCLREHWSVRKLEQAIRAEESESKAATPSTVRPAGAVRAAWLVDLETQLTAGLQTPVRVTPGRSRGTGSVTLEYRTLEDFDRLLLQLGVQTG